MTQVKTCKEAREEVLANVSTGIDRKANTRGGGALERGHGAPLETLAQLGEALGCVGDIVKVVLFAAELVASQTAMGGR